MRVKILETGYETEMPPYTAFLMVLKGVAQFVATNEEEGRAIEEVTKLLPKPEGYWFDNIPQDLEEIVLEKLKDKRRITSDDVHAEIMSRAKGRSPKVVGSVFMSLKKKGLIRPVGSAPTERGVAHRRRVILWEKC